MKFSILAVLALSHSSAAFQLPANKVPILSTPICHTESSTACFGHEDIHEEDEIRLRGGFRRLVSKMKKPIVFLTLASSAALLAAPEQAQASAPVMAMPKAEVRDPAMDAIENHERKMQGEAQEELRRFNAKARQVEAAEGPAARGKFEEEYKANQERLAQERLDNIEKLKRDLLDQGICPFQDIEGQRQLLEAEKGVDLGMVAGTPFYVEKEYEQKGSVKSWANRKAANREMIKCMVEDMKNRDIDPVEYFASHQQKTADILDLPAAQAAALVTKYRENLDLYGQLVPPKEGEMSAKEKMTKSGKGSQASKDEAKRLKAEAKAKAAEEKAAAKAKAKAEKEQIKAEKAAAKEAAKKEKEAGKAAAVLAAEDTDVTEATAEPAESSDGNGQAIEEPTEETQALSEKKSSNGVPILPLAVSVVAVGGGGYAVKIMRDKAAADEEERQRQFQLLMGGMDSDSSPSSAPALEVDTDLSDMVFEEETHRESDDAPAEISDMAPKKKKKRGFFGKKKNSREIDINNLVSSGAKAPEFAMLLAKILTFGAPGRFPEVVALPGNMPMQEFEVDAACAKLTEAQASAGLSKEEAAEVFANVVNCMLIDIVDLASTSLKEKDQKLTVDAISIVVDFMNHAASLYTAIAEDVVITPVTYGGDLSKGKLEQMYSAYAASGMTNMMGMDEDFEGRVNLLQDVFQINDKKAEGLMMKTMQKNMMEMLKSGEGMEGMEEMMKGMGMEGLAGGLPGQDGEEPSPEQLKEMLTALKDLKDSGSIPPNELEEVKKQFKEAFGSSIDEVMKDADKAEGELGTQDKELLDLMKSILDD